MTWINMLGPLQWLLLAAIPPAILSLYFLKLRRQESVVPSTMLWKKAIEDLHVNSIWQRIRNNLLLYLQLLFLGLLILACVRPGWSGMNRVGERRIYILDHSASMQAVEGGTSRLEQARQKALRLLQDASSDDVAMVISTSDRAMVEQGFTNNKGLLEKAIQRIEATNHTTEVSEAFRVASGLANPGRASFEDNVDIQVADAVPATVYFLSDGAVGPLDESEFGQLKIEYVPIGEQDTPNVAVLGFAVQRPEGASGGSLGGASDKIEVFAVTSNQGDQPVEATASLYHQEQLIDAQKISIPARQESGLQFEVQGIDSGSFKLVIDHRDALPLDNVAYAAIRPDRQVNVLLVTAGNMALEKALQTQRIDRLAEVRVESPSFLGAEEYGLAAAEGRFDLIIYDGCTPSKMPAASTLFIGGLPPQDIQPIPPPGTNPSPATNPIPAGNGSAPAATLNEEEKWQFGPPSGPVIILDVNRSHPISQYVEMASVSIVESRTVKPPSSGSILMISDVGPVFGIAPRGPFQDAVLGFDIVRPTENGTEMNSDWGIKRSFPVFVFSAVEQLAGGVTQAGAATVQPGQAMPLVLSNRFKNYKIVNPIGKTESIERGSDGRFLYTRTEEPGVYEIFAEGLNEPVDRFCVNLFSERESNLAVGLELKTSSEAIPATDAKIRARQETWRWLLLLALGLLMLEWVVFNKRIFV